MIRVLVVDDHSIVRVGLERLLQQSDDIDVVGVSDRGETAVELDGELCPDVVLMDLSMPGISGIEATRRILANRTDAVVVVLTAATDRGHVLDAIEAGAIGYLVKDADPATLVDGIRAAAGGDSPIDPRAARHVIHSRPTTSPNPTLTDRENEVLHLVSEGLANKAIARRLSISEKTVKAHLTRVFAAIGVTDRTQAALWARDHLGLDRR